MKKTKIAIVAGLLVTLGALGAAQAGWAINSTVYTQPTYAYGSVRDTRHSADPNEYIYCYARSWVSSEQGVCYARDTAGNFRMCVTSDPEQISTIRAIGPASEIYFTITSGSSQCNFVTSTNGSIYLD